MSPSALYEAIRHTLEEDARLNIKELCSLAGVSRSGYYRWLSAKDRREQRELQDQTDFLLIKEAYSFRGYEKGRRGIAMRLRRMGHPMNHKKVQRLMRKYGLFCPVRKANPYRRMMKNMKTDAVAPNIVQRRFRELGARKVLLTDITYIRLKDRFCYLSVIMDAYTEQVLAYHLSLSLEVDIVLSTIEKLMRDHSTSLDTEVLIHSDQGSHYTSVAFRKLLQDNALRQSMSRRGNCWDNSPQESFFGHMKDELRPFAQGWRSFEDVASRIDDWMDYYNNDRLKYSLGEMSPNEYYNYLVTNEQPTALMEKIP